MSILKHVLLCTSICESVGIPTYTYLHKIAEVYDFCLISSPRAPNWCSSILHPTSGRRAAYIGRQGGVPGSLAVAMICSPVVAELGGASNVEASSLRGDGRVGAQLWVAEVLPGYLPEASPLVTPRPRSNKKKTSPSVQAQGRRGRKIKFPTGNHNALPHSPFKFPCLPIFLSSDISFSSLPTFTSSNLPGNHYTHLISSIADIFRRSFSLLDKQTALIRKFFGCLSIVPSADTKNEVLNHRRSDPPRHYHLSIQLIHKAASGRQGAGGKRMPDYVDCRHTRADRSRSYGGGEGQPQGTLSDRIVGDKPG